MKTTGRCRFLYIYQFQALHLSVCGSPRVLPNSIPCTFFNPVRTCCHVKQIRDVIRLGYNLPVEENGGPTLWWSLPLLHTPRSIMSLRLPSHNSSKDYNLSYSANFALPVNMSLFTLTPLHISIRYSFLQSHLVWPRSGCDNWSVQGCLDILSFETVPWMGMTASLRMFGWVLRSA